VAEVRKELAKDSERTIKPKPAVNVRSPDPGLTVSQRLQIGAHVLDLAAGELLNADGERAALRKQALSVLLLLGARAGQVVSKDELTQRVWPNVVVGEGSLTQAVVDIRRVLRDHDHHLVRNVARRGYMLVPTADDGRAASAQASEAGVSAVATKTAPADRTADAKATPGAAPTRPAWRRGWAALAMIATLAIALVAWNQQRSPAPARLEELSIVVLPLAVEGGSADTEALAAVLHNDLIDEMSRFDGSVVIARGTAATYRDRPVDPRAVARELNVRHVVSGSLRRDGERVRVALTLSDGASGEQRWSEVFEVERPWLGQALDESVSKLARALYINAWKSAAVRSNALSPSRMTADDLTTRAWGQWFRGFNRDSTLGLIALGEQAVAADPDSARGWAAIAVGNVQALNGDWIVGADARLAARQRADLASAALDRLDPDGNAAMQARVIKAFNRQDFTGMLERARMWVDRHPGPTACGAFGEALHHTDDPEAAIHWLERALRLSPLDPFRAEWMYRLAWSHYVAGNSEQALIWARKAEATNPLLPWPPVQSAALLQLDRRGEAQASWDDFHRRHPGYDHVSVLRRLAGDFPRFSAARARLLAQLGELGMT
jgi:TolB-like protein/DNA-binding winged helix-turn-helix (wHTH) protein